MGHSVYIDNILYRPIQHCNHNDQLRWRFLYSLLLTRQLAYASLDRVAPSGLWPYSWTSINSLPRPWRLSIIVLRTRTIEFKEDHFSRGIISYDSWGYVCTRGVVSQIQIIPAGYAFSKGGPHYM